MTDPRTGDEGNPYAAPKARLEARRRRRHRPIMRPTSMTVFGVLDCVYGGISGLGGLLALAGALMLGEDPDPNPILDAMPTGWLVIANVVGILVSALLVVSGVRILARAGTRSFAMLVSMIWLGWTAVSIVVQLVLIMPELREHSSAVVAGALVGAALGGLCPLTYHGLRMYFLSQPPALAWFKGEVDEDGPT